MKTNVYEEICCDECNEIIHNHFDCPVCIAKSDKNRGYQGTDHYSQIGNYETLIKCEDCNTLFQRVNEEDSWYLDDLEIVEIPNPFENL